MDHEIVADIDLRQHTVDGKFIIVLTQGACHIVFVITGSVLFAEHCDVMISAVHSRPHQVDCAGVHSDIFFMRMFLMDCFCHKAAVRSHHIASQLRVDCHIPHACRNKDFLIDFAHAFTDRADVVRLLIRSVRNADPSGKINELDMHSRFF